MAMRYGTSKEWLRTLAVAGLGCVLLAGVWLLHASHAPLPQRHYVAISGGLLVICGAASVLLWRHGGRRDVAIVLVVALAARLLLAFDPPRRTLTISNWTRFGLDEITFGGHRPVLVAPTTAVSLPWVGWLVEGFDGTGVLLTLVVPVRFAGKLRGGDGRAQLHRFRSDDDQLPALATAGRVI